MESEVRAAGRIVVWQLAADELSTAMMSSLSATSPNPDDPNTSRPVDDSTSSEWFDEEVGAVHRLRRERDEHEDRDEDERREHTGQAGCRVGVGRTPR